MISIAGIVAILVIVVIIIIVARAAMSSDRIKQGEYISSTKKAYEQKVDERENVREEASTDELKFADRETTLSTVKSDGLLLEYVSEEYRNDREIVLAAIQEGMSLENEWAVDPLISEPATPLKFASDSLQDDEEVVTIAIEQSYEAFFHASSELRSNPDIIFQALENECSLPYLDDKVLESISPLLLRDASKFYEFLKEFERRDYDEYRVGDEDIVLVLGIDDGPSVDLVPDESVPYLDMLSDDIKEMFKYETIHEAALNETR